MTNGKIMVLGVPIFKHFRVNSNSTFVLMLIQQCLTGYFQNLRGYI